MAGAEHDPNRGDPFGLDRFVQAQEGAYAQALGEIRGGRKRTHWMWYIFPQLDGLGFSATSRHFAIKGLDEARAYLEHPVLGPMLLECAKAALRVEGRTASEIFGSPDDLKLRSSLTLFARAAPDEPLFRQALDRYFAGEPDPRTLQKLG